MDAARAGALYRAGVVETLNGAAGSPLYTGGFGPPRRPGRGVPAWVRLVVPAVVIGAIQVGITTLAARNQPEARDLDGWAVALLVGSAAALLLRWHFPALCLVLAATATVGYWLADYPHGPVFLALLFAFVNAVLRGRRRVAWGTLAVGYVVLAWVEPALRTAVAQLAGRRRPAGLGARPRGRDRARAQPAGAGGRRRPRTRAEEARRQASATSGCASPGSCTTCWPTTSR